MIIETDQAPAAAARQYAAACQIAKSLQNDAPLPRSLATEAMTAAYGSSSADGTLTQRDSFLGNEVRTQLALRSMMPTETTTEIVEEHGESQRPLPTQKVRSTGRTLHPNLQPTYAPEPIAL